MLAPFVAVWLWIANLDYEWLIGVERLMARKQDPKSRLADDARRTAGYMEAVAADARRQGAELPDAMLACVLVWRHWSARLAVWARGDTEASP
jgi:hypothetical protein